MKLLHGVILIVLALVIVGTSQALFTVDQREQAIVLQLGKPMGEVKGPGLHWKIPLVQEVRTFDRRVLPVDPQPEQMVLSANQAVEMSDKPEDAAANKVLMDDVSSEPIIVDTFARYRITDPLMFMKTLQTVVRANQNLENIMNGATRDVLGNTTLQQLLSPKRAQIMEDIRGRVNRTIAKDEMGIELVDIRIVRTDLTKKSEERTVNRMISDFSKRATETRSEGEERALEIKSTAEKERSVLLAEAQRDSQIIRGEGDKIAIKTYAEAFNKDKDFYGFTRSMEAYKNTMANPETRLILSPDSEFFKHFKGE
ncbi:MAG: protease modulator HflC [Rhodospirillales bacterium]|nr:protease modulator HflC [Rhodospirillales bacterium]